MEELRVGDQTIRFDREATAAVYASIEVAGTQECGCLYCQNFAAQRGSIYPPFFVELLQRLGIDPDKEAEVFEYGAPPRDGCYLYGGWFLLVGELLVAGERLTIRPEVPEFSYCFGAGQPRDERFSSQLAVEFTTRIPWVLPERLE